MSERNKHNTAETVTRVVELLAGEGWSPDPRTVSAVLDAISGDVSLSVDREDGQPVAAVEVSLSFGGGGGGGPRATPTGGTRAGGPVTWWASRVRCSNPGSGRTTTSSRPTAAGWSSGTSYGRLSTCP